MSQTPAANPYLRTRIMTASPEQLRLMLYDGAIKFCRQGRHALNQRDYEGLYESLTRAQKIVMELSTSLNHEIAPDLCDRMTALYNYVYRRLVDASIERDPAAIDEAIELIEYERETWSILLRKLQEEADDASAPADTAETGPAASAANTNPAPGQRQAPPTQPSNSVIASIGLSAPYDGGSDAPGPSGFSAEG